MRRFLPLIIGVFVTLLAGCVDKKDLCAQAAVGVLSEEQRRDTYKKLGIKQPYSVGTAYSGEKNRRRIDRYCEFYKN